MTLPRPRKRFTTAQRFELLKQEGHRCHLCKGPITPGQAWDISHEIPLELYARDDESNRRAAMRGGRTDALKRRMDGTVVVRATGAPWRPQTIRRAAA